MSNDLPAGAPPAEAEPAWLRGADDEERAELQALGVIDAPPTDDAARDAFASSMLRRKHFLEGDLERLVKAEAHETLAIAQRYARLRAPLESRARAIGHLLLDLAAKLTLPTKKRSVSVGWGTLGRRQLPASIVITDDAALLEDARNRAPEEVTWSLEVPLTVAQAILSGDALSRGGTRIGVAAIKRALSKVPDLAGVERKAGEERPYFEVQSPMVLTVEAPASDG